MSSSPTLDPVCGRAVDPLRARAVGIFGGVTYYFCSAACKASYADPRTSLADVATVQATAVAPAPTERPSERRTPARSEPFVVATPAIDEEPAELEPPRRKSVLPLVLGAAVIVGIAGLVAARRNAQPPAPVATPPVVAPVPSPPPPVAPAAAPVPTYADLVPPLKLGMRHFVTSAAVASVQLLVIDSEDRAVVVPVAALEGADTAVANTSDAIAPEPAFATASAAVGTVFSTSLVAGDHKIDVRVVREAEALLPQTRGDDGPWRDVARIKLATDAQVRAAAFAKKRYLSEEKQ